MVWRAREGEESTAGDDRAGRETARCLTALPCGRRFGPWTRKFGRLRKCHDVPAAPELI
ncbi:uncharacterized protein PITG_19566 [Phytophthora infestans T30-4]|uniref:Uncharacterized protein n=1 Tax=Phytophthora infestans (strain T30-4) TaxID=403677 RepID=D0P0L7_PHYIT|nr:uncharacterized protein PITG_19566 [Phytophthora infestans T30-4]EEY52983.1 hypothetical protein PITG_19566 [Phytophthora infestans T30-4]|eukprot:XP_002896155.1 hypothetical protein PITG_19566 [Phytophthora infestans T30-4]